MSIIKKVKKYSIDEQPKDCSFWRSRPYDERLNALEEIRKAYHLWRYGAEPGFQRVFRMSKQK